MGRCDTCGNEYERSFNIVMNGNNYTFDCFECAIHLVAPVCKHCGCKVVGHGVQAGTQVFCCGHCARATGIYGLKTHLDVPASAFRAEAKHTSSEVSRRHGVNPGNPGGNPMVRFVDRRDAGRKLAAQLQIYQLEHPIVLGLPRGGVVVAHEIAQALGAPLDAWVVRKIGVPWHPELGMGAVAEGGFVYLSPDISASAGVSSEDLSAYIEAKRGEVQERVQRFRKGHPAPELEGRTVILVDDGIATGGTVRVALQAIRAQRPRKIVLAVPVASAGTVEEMSANVDDVVALQAPAQLYAIGLWYDDFQQVADEQVVELLARGRRAAPEEPQLSV